MGRLTVEGARRLPSPPLATPQIKVLTNSMTDGSSAEAVPSPSEATNPIQSSLPPSRSTASAATDFLAEAFKRAEEREVRAAANQERLRNQPPSVDPSLPFKPGERATDEIIKAVTEEAAIHPGNTVSRTVALADRDRTPATISIGIKDFRSRYGNEAANQLLKKQRGYKGLPHAGTQPATPSPDEAAKLLGLGANEEE